MAEVPKVTRLHCDEVVAVCLLEWLALLSLDQICRKSLTSLNSSKEIVPSVRQHVCQFYKCILTNIRSVKAFPRELLIGPLRLQGCGQCEFRCLGLTILFHNRYYPDSHYDRDPSNDDPGEIHLIA